VNKKDIYQLKKGRTYRVIQSFSDYDGIPHPVGETWIFKETNYNAYHSGLTLHVWQNGEEKVYRFLDYPGDDVIIKECMDYVQWLEEIPPFYFEPEGR
jgi:hypothetical protein